MDPSSYGTIRSTTLFQDFTRYIVIDNKRIFEIDVSIDGNRNNVRILNVSDFAWTDTKLSEGFKRTIGKSVLYFIDGEIVLRKQILPAKAFSRGKVDDSIITEFVTLDIETIKNSNGDLIPYLIKARNKDIEVEAFGGKQNELFNNFITKLTSKFFTKQTKNSLIVYAHNLSGFDGIFLMIHLIKFGKVEPLLFNGKLISIKVKLNSGKIIQFKDSYLLLPFSLSTLCKTFNIDKPKGNFPFKLTNIHYSGVFPKYEYWTNISRSTWQQLKAQHGNRLWNFEVESKKYCSLDCIVLHEILTKFNELVYNKFQVNIHKSLTLPSLAMRIYKTHYMPENSIYQLLGKVEEAIRLSYTGGHVDAYIPHNRLGTRIRDGFKKLFYYDVNSLYPFVMATFSMPIGKPIVFKGDIRRMEPKAYGFFYCTIASPKYLEHPILQRRIKTTFGIRTIAGLGSWQGWIYSKEMDNAIKYGYSFKIHHGYQFEEGNIFKEYVLAMYLLRSEFAKDHPMNQIAKLLMNSLYGKFGMKLQTTKVDIMPILTKEDKVAFRKYLDKYGDSLQDYVNLHDNIVVIRNTEARLFYNEQLDLYHGQDVNIAIASAVTASARIYMSQFKNSDLYNLYYSDTDSIVIDRPLSMELVGNKLGQLKLEYVIKRGIFLAPKVYGLVTSDNKEVIKVKGLRPEVLYEFNMDNLEELLHENKTIEFNQEKWYKDIINGNISIKDVAYSLKVTSSKREAIYVNKSFESTKPFIYSEIDN